MSSSDYSVQTDWILKKNLILLFSDSGSIYLKSILSLQGKLLKTAATPKYLSVWIRIFLYYDA